jgi:uncharacterized protein (DUF736 family)
MAYDDTNRGALFKAKNKPSDNHPDYSGKINVDGTEFWLSAWIKESKEGEKYMSLSVQPKTDKGGRAKPGKPDSNMDADIPF